MENLIEDTIAYLKVVIADKETPDIVKETAKTLLNSWIYRKSLMKVPNKEKEK